MQTPPTEGLRQLASARKDSMDFLLFFFCYFVLLKIIQCHQHHKERCT